MRRLLPHIHWFSLVVWTRADGLNPPYKKCRCGAARAMGDSARWGIGLDGEWFYDDALYE